MSVKRMIIILGVLVLMVACKPSDKYAGEWYAISGEGNAMIEFSKEKVLTIESEGNIETLEFNQNSTGFINEVKYYGLDIEGESYYVVFDNKKDEENAKLIRQTNQASDFKDVVGDIVFEMNRNEYPK